MRFEASTEVGAPSHEVFATYVDVAHWPSWTSSVNGVELLDPGPFRVGSRARVRQPRLPDAIWQVTELEPGQSFTWVARTRGVVSTGTHQVQALPEGTCRVVATLDQRGPLAPLVGLLMKGLIRAYLQTEVRGLKAYCEA